MSKACRHRFLVLMIGNGVKSAHSFALGLPAMFGLMKKFDRAAVLTDKTWLKKVSEFEGALYPGLEIKAFNIDQKAEAWLSS
ncbi:MAG: STAS/SEC14 domain-containing protein [Desulfobacterales bacterium]